VWVPIEYVGKALSYFMLYRNELTILIHPLTSHSVEDHSGRAIFLGPVFPIDLTVLEGADDPQYPELGLGYSAQTLREPATV
jgi:aromatic ring-cleaving dioxygenase